jgi:gas vesicle protein
MSPDADTVHPSSLPRRALLAAAGRRAELRHAIRVSAAVAATFAIGELFRLPQAYWAIFTAVIVVQTSVGATITASMERLAGTVVGALIGAAAAYVQASTVLAEGLTLSAAIAVAAFAAAVRPSLRVAPVTAAIVLVGGLAIRMDPLVAAAWRVVEIFLGSIVGVAVTLLVFPARARKAVAERAARSMSQLAGLFEQFAKALEGQDVESAVHDAHRTIRASLAQVEQALSETARESLSGLSRPPPPDGLPRSLRRIGNDGVMVGRALGQPLPDTVAGLLGPAAARLLKAVAQELEACTAAVRAGRAPEDGRLDQPRAAFEAAVERVRAAKLTSELDLDTAARVFGLVFALESLLGNLADLSDRIAEMAAQAVPSTGRGPPAASRVP